MTLKSETVQKFEERKAGMTEQQRKFFGGLVHGLQSLQVQPEELKDMRDIFKRLAEKEDENGGKAPSYHEFHNMMQDEFNNYDNIAVLIKMALVLDVVNEYGVDLWDFVQVADVLLELKDIEIGGADNE